MPCRSSRVRRAEEHSLVRRAEEHSLVCVSAVLALRRQELWFWCCKVRAHRATPFFFDASRARQSGTALFLLEPRSMPSGRKR